VEREIGDPPTKKKSIKQYKKQQNLTKWTKIQDRVDVSAPKLSTIKYLEYENHVSEEFFFTVSGYSPAFTGRLDKRKSTRVSNDCSEDIQYLPGAISIILI
jgi:hypothetical protein